MKNLFLLLLISLFPLHSSAFSYKNLLNPYGVYVDETGFIYVTCRNGDPATKDSNGYIVKLKPDGSFDSERFIAESTGANLHAPTSIVISADKIYIADIDSIKIFEKSSLRQISEVNFSKNKIEPKHIFGLTVGPDLAIYATDGPANAIYRIDPVTFDAQMFLKNKSFGQPHAIIWNPNKLIFLVSGYESGNLFAFDIKGKIVSMPDIYLKSLEGMTQDMSGMVYVSSSGLGSVFRLDQQFAINPYVNGLQSVAGIAWSKKGELLAVLPITGELVSVPKK